MVKRLQPSLHKHGEECIDQNEREAEEEERVNRDYVGGDLKGSGLKCRSGRVAELLGNMDEHAYCDIRAVWLELGDQVNKEGGKEGSEKTILEPDQQPCIVVNVRTYKNEHGICQISPLDLPEVVVH